MPSILGRSNTTTRLFVMRCLRATRLLYLSFKQTCIAGCLEGYQYSDMERKKQATADSLVEARDPFVQAVAPPERMWILCFLATGMHGAMSGSRQRNCYRDACLNFLILTQIIRMIGTMQDGPKVILIMEHMSGGDLENYTYACKSR